jgi:DNA-binding response OmpR family regulator
MDAAEHMAVERRRVTVINDDAEILAILREILEEQEYEVVGLRGAEQSIEEIAVTTPDLLVVDLRLDPQASRLSGWDMVAMSRVHPRLRHVPIIVISADVFAINERADELQAYGDVHLMVKPFEVTTLEELVRRLLDRTVPSPLHGDGDSGQAAEAV